MHEYIMNSCYDILTLSLRASQEVFLLSGYDRLNCDIWTLELLIKAGHATGAIFTVL